MSHNLEELHTMAQEVRTAFTDGVIKAEEILLATAAYLPSRYETWKEILEHAQGEQMTRFPKGFCGFSSVILRERIGFGEIIGGSYILKEGRGRTHPFSIQREPHVFLNVGRTPLGSKTIVDITADQFTDGPEIYIGHLRMPWREKL